MSKRSIHYNSENKSFVYENFAVLLYSDISKDNQGIKSTKGDELWKAGTMLISYLRDMIFKY